MNSGNARPTIVRHSKLQLDTRNSVCDIDGIRFAASVGNWMFYNAGRPEKYFHAKAGRIDCIHKSNPYLSPKRFVSHLFNSRARYKLSDWSKALHTKLVTRVAEVWISSERLARAGLGPWPGDIILVGSFVRDGADLGPTAGFGTEDVMVMKGKKPATEAEIYAAGVQIDRLRSAVTQQLNGYVIDLCSVVGAIPLDADHEVSELSKRVDLHQQISQAMVRGANA